MLIDLVNGQFVLDNIPMIGFRQCNHIGVEDRARASFLSPITPKPDKSTDYF